MSLASTLNTTKSIFNNTSAQSAVVATNIQNASNADYNRRTASTTVNIYNGALILTTERAQNSALLKQLLAATASNSGQQQLLQGLETVNSLLGGTEYSLTPSTYISTLRDTLQTYAATPGDITLAQSVISAAQDVANSLNNAANGLQELRSDVDVEIANSVSTLNKLLGDFEVANKAVKQATLTGEDSTTAEDKREALLKQISEIVGVTTYIREGNDMALYTSEGTTLFETVPRTVSFTPTAAYVASSEGKSIYIDGVAVSLGEGASTTAQGSLQALLQLRDEILPGFQDQMDEIARGLMLLFSETDASGNAVAGLFTTSSGAAVDFGTDQIIQGLAASITVSAAAIAAPLKLRDGNIAGESVNTENASGYSDLLRGYLAGFDTAMSFDGAARLGTSLTLLDFATDSIGWIEEYRSHATRAGETTTAMLSRATEAYSNSTGVNLDEELVLLLDIEQSYKAAAKLLATVDEMLQALLQAAG